MTVAIVKYYNRYSELLSLFFSLSQFCAYKLNSSYSYNLNRVVNCLFFVVYFLHWAPHPWEHFKQCLVQESDDDRCAMFSHLLSVQLLKFVLLCPHHFILLTQPAKFGLKRKQLRVDTLYA